MVWIVSGKPTMFPVDIWENSIGRNDMTRPCRRNPLDAPHNAMADMQIVWINEGDKFEELAIPSAGQEVVAGVPWGAVDQFYTAAFWKCQTELHVRKNQYTSHQLGRNLTEEVAVCLLGGYGIPAEMGLLAFDRLRAQDLLKPGVSEIVLQEQLAEPFCIGGRSKRYRFHSQKARYLSLCLAALEDIPTDCSDLELREALMALPGIGPKTASWIVRNHRCSDSVAIIDIHLHRAGQMMGLFAQNSEPTRDYLKLEASFLDLCRAIAVKASVLDALIWDYMRRAGPTSGLTAPVKQKSYQSTQLALAI
nr:hypothetical protein [uncultured Rhizobium sp.]